MNPDICNVTWTSPSKNSVGSMPIGNGDFGANVWATEDGELRLYLGKTDAWDESSRLLKLGEMAISAADAPLAEWMREGFEQKLLLERGCIEISLGPEGKRRLSFRLWVDANRPVLWIETESGELSELSVRLMTWRTEVRELRGKETSSSMEQDGEHEKVFEYPDSIVPADQLRPGQIGLLHHNRESMLESSLEAQDMPELKGAIDDPVKNRAFGCLITVPGGEPGGESSLAEQTLGVPLNNGAAVVAATAFCERVETPGNWAEGARKLTDEALSVGAEAARAAHESWWGAFWKRSDIEVSGDETADAISRAYALQRYVTACAGRGSFPIKFNGSIFTAHGPEERMRGDGEGSYNPDYRRWGGGYWFQNTRLIYWSLLATGDWEMMRPWFDLFESAAPLCRHRCREQFDKPGLFFPETMLMWGTYRNRDYGYRDARSGDPDLHPGLTKNTFIRRYWQGGLELSMILLDYLAFTGDEAWWQRQAYPLVRDILCFYHDYYDRRDASGKIRFEPSQSLETWHVASNPAPEIAGLREVLGRLLELPEKLTESGDREFFQSYRDALPPIPVERPYPDYPGRILAAEAYDGLKNMENPELYPVFPYTQGALGGELHAQANNTWPVRRMRTVGGWMQDALHAAMLGRGEEAANLITATLAPELATERQRKPLIAERHPDIRFPGFFGPNFDWVPDQDHGSVNMLALQKMCLQTQHGQIRVCPAWPARWNVRFKLHAPGGTIVEADYRDGGLREVSVEPKEREADLVRPDADGA